MNNIASFTQTLFHFPGGCMIPTEEREEYRAGGFLPVTLGQKLDCGRYVVLRKLGYGSYATVWLALDTISTERCYVAIKILRADQDNAPGHDNPELRAYHHLLQHGSSPQIVKLIRFFSEGSPYAHYQWHICLVLEPMGPSCDKLVRRGSLEYWKAKLIIRSGAQALKSLHSCRLVHGDLRLQNMFQSVRGLSRLDPSQVKQERGQEGIHSETLKLLQGVKTQHAYPEYLLESAPLYEVADHQIKTMKVKISDMGESFILGKPPSYLGLPSTFQPPEALLGMRIDEKVDIWSFGCTIYNLLTRREPFSVGMFGSRSETKKMNRMMIQFEKELGRLPHAYEQAWKDRIASKSREPPSGSDTYEAGNDDRDAPLSRPLEHRFKERTAGKLQPDQQREMWGLIESCLRYHPRERPSAQDILDRL